MNGRYESSPPNLRSLRDRLIATAEREGVVFGRLQQHIGVLVVAQLMVAIADGADEPLLLVKGGASMELRRGIPQSRTTKDLDAVVRGDIHAVHDQLVQAGVEGWRGFNSIFTPPAAFRVAGLAHDAHRFTAKLRYHGKPFASVPIEVSPIEIGNADHYDEINSNALTLVGFATAAPVPCMTLPWQIAQKIHACTEPPGTTRRNDRAHDLADLQLLEASIADEPLGATRDASVAVFESRSTHSWPPVLTAQPHWAPIYTRSIEGLEHLGLAATVQEAASAVQSFIDRISEARAG